MELVLKKERTYLMSLESNETLKELTEQNRTLDDINNRQLDSNNTLQELKYQIDENGRELRKINTTLDYIFALVFGAVFFYVTPQVATFVKHLFRMITD